MKKVPNLRFKEFSGEWEEKQLGKIVKFTNGKVHENCIDEQGEYIVVNSKFISSNGKVIKKSRENLCSLNMGDIAFVMSDVPNGRALAKCYFIEQNSKYTLNQRICALTPMSIESKFLFYILNRHKYFLKFDNRVGQTNLRKDDVLNCPLTIPSLKEQEKIAAFFSLIDKKIALQTEKVEELKNYKKGLMQKIFSQELRFKDENGNEYPEWEEKTLQQIGFTYAGLSGKTKEDFGFGNGSFVTYINVFRNTLAKRMIEQVNISEQENQNPVLKGDLLFTTSSETPNEVGMVSCWDYEIKNLYLNSFCFGYRIYNHNSYSPIFLAYMLRSGEYRKKISILAQGSTRYNISKTELMKMKVQCPCMEEQQKIVALLLNLELKTEEEQNKLNELLQYKKGLLQQMFI